MKGKTISNIVSLLFVVVFLYTGVSKLINYSVFKEELALSPILRLSAPLIACTLPLTEIAAAIMLLLPRWRKAGLYSALILMIIFTIYIGTILLFDNQIACGCGGAMESLSSKQHLIVNIILTAIAFTGLLLERTFNGQKSASNL